MATNGLLTQKELYWRDHYHWLFERGYRLRSRYHPDWVPSWTASGKRWQSCEDSWNTNVESTMNDAFRISDDRHVVLKRVSRTEFPEEVKILQYFSQNHLASDPANHCISLLDVLSPPDDLGHDIVVLPLLRTYDDPPFETVGEALAFLREVFEGFAFLHQHRVAHRDVKGDNILMDAKALGISDFSFNQHPMNKDGSGPVKPKYRRTEQWPRYYIIDFGFSSQYAPDNMPPSVPPLPASDLSLPELNAPAHRFNPFPSDVYYVGNWTKMELLDGNPLDPLRPGFKTLEFLRPLVKDMTQHQPSERITMDEAVKRLDSILQDLSVATLRSQLEENTVFGISKTDLIAKAFTHWRRRLLYVLRRKPPIPPSTLSTPAPSVLNQAIASTDKKEDSAGASSRGQNPSNAVALPTTSGAVAPVPLTSQRPPSPTSAPLPASPPV